MRAVRLKELEEMVAKLLVTAGKLPARCRTATTRLRRPGDFARADSRSWRDAAFINPSPNPRLNRYISLSRAELICAFLLYLPHIGRLEQLKPENQAWQCRFNFFGNFNLTLI
jgi:hypothetical protein